MKFTIEQKQDLVSRYYAGESAYDICMKERIPKSTFYTWITPHKEVNGYSKIVVTPDKYQKLKQKVEKQSLIIEVLQKIHCTASSPLKERLSELEKLYGQYSTYVLCDALLVARGTFINHMNKGKNGFDYFKRRREDLSIHIKDIYDKSNQIYGAKKIKSILNNQGFLVSEKMVGELMSDLNIQSIRIGSKKNHFEFTSEKKVDKVKMKFKVDSPNEIWVSDTTYFKFKNIFYYICVIIDLYSRKVIAFAISKKHSTQLITSTFRLAYASRSPQGKLTFHSDRGTQYTSFAFRNLLKYYSVIQSFSPAGRPKSNAVAEAFFSTLKREELYRCVYHSEIEFRNRVKDYMDFYNSERPHITLNYKSPNTYEKQFYATQEKSRKQNGQFKST